MQIIRPVRIKVIVTDELKRELTAGARRVRQEIDSRIQSIETEGRRLVERVQRENVVQASQIREQIEEEKQQLMQARREWDTRLRGFEALALGAEVERGTSQCLEEVNVGDPSGKVLLPIDIVLDGDVIKEIREGKEEPEEGSEEPAGEVVQGPGSSPIIVTP
jgi:hypothetical protein